ncbi:signal peptidase I [Actinoplanes palleronii]|uniref:Signal peptidase I n=1 Tax=Actinoplanes palleronii TaxID=113570 RepID=A0ABQ4BDI0_9ACTN|nr:signal peptidase I [Actinoplanes palleronii]GIE68640.1 hypothetical protein Apa02nite_047480 [Actinoplanes palleronii]
MTVFAQHLPRLAWLCAAATGVLLLSGWSAAVVASGSMHPAVDTGDVVLMSPPGRVRAGQVIRFRDPGRPGRTTLHRVARFDGRGRLITQGDANRVADHRPVPPGAVVGAARLRVPYLGWPVLWWIRGEYGKVVALVLAGLTGPPGVVRLRSRRSGRRPSR